MDIPPDGHYVSSSLMLFSEQEQAIDAVLSDLRRQVPAILAILVARDGQFISASGEAANRVDLVGLGSLIAGDLAASHRVAELMGVYEERQVVLREGRDSQIFVADAGPHMLLFVMAAGDVPTGWLRLLGLEACKALAQIAHRPEPARRPAPPAGGAAERALADEVDQALGSIWQDNASEGRLLPAD